MVVVFWYILLGAILIGIGLILYFRGKALMCLEKTKAIGRLFYAGSLLCIGLGGIAFLCPIVIWILLFG